MVATRLGPEELEQFHRTFDRLSTGVRELLIEALPVEVERKGKPPGDGELRKMAKANVLSQGRLSIFTGQYAEVPLAKLLPIFKAMGYTGIELACWHFDVNRAAVEDGQAYCDEIRQLVESNGMVITALSDHLISQALCDLPSAKLKGIVGKDIWSDDPVQLVKNVQDHMKKVGLVAKRMGVKVVNGFTGRSDWADIYDFPPGANYDKAYETFAERMMPVLIYYAQLGIKFALEVHPTEIAYDMNTTRATLAAIKRAAQALADEDLPEGVTREMVEMAFGLNFDPSHLVHQNIDPVDFILEFHARILNMHAKDTKIHDTGHQGTYASHLPMGDQWRRWNFVSPGRGCVDFDAIARALMFVGYTGFIAVEWEDTMMNRWVGAYEAFVFIRDRMLFPRSDKRFDEAFAAKDDTAVEGATADVAPAGEAGHAAQP